MRVARLVPGRRAPDELTGAVLTRDLLVDGRRWAKGRRLSPADLGRLGDAARPTDRWPASVSVLVLEPGDVHEDEAAVRLATAIAGGDVAISGLTIRGPVQSRVDLAAAADGVVDVRLAALERLNRIDALEVFTAFDGQVVERGELVASVKVAPHVVPAADLERAEAIARRSGPVVRLRPFLARRVAVVVKESAGDVSHQRFEQSIRTRLDGLGATLVTIEYLRDDPGELRAAFRRLTRGPDAVDIVLAAGAASTDPADAMFEAFAAAGGRIVRRGAPAHPGSMLWLGRLGSVPVLGLPTCGAYSKATAVDLLLPRLVAGEPATRATVARLGHGGILTRDQRFRFPKYARRLEGPDG